MRKELPLYIFVLLCLLIGMPMLLAQYDMNERSSFPGDNVSIGLPDDDEGDDEADDECDDECDDYPAPVARTGQTISYEYGDDGDLRKGVCWPEPRFTDNENGTVTDHLTGLVWLQDAMRFTSRGWNPALNACNNLADDGGALTDGSVAGDWRLPNNREMRSLIDLGSTNPALPLGHPFIVPASGVFWTSTTAINNTGRAWTIEDATMVNDPKGTSNLVWPVRDAVPEDLGPAPTPKTGQTISYGNRDDGELQEGVEWPDPRFNDNLDGTVTDKLTGLIWLQDSTRFAGASFSDALAVCNLLGDDGIDLTDGSLPGEWRLPSIWELSSLNDYSQIGPALPVGHPFIANAAGTFWSSTTYVENDNRAWTIGMGIGKASHLPKGGSNSFWPVRGCDDDEYEDHHESAGWHLDAPGFGNTLSDLMEHNDPLDETSDTLQDRDYRTRERSVRPTEPRPKDTRELEPGR